MTQDNRVSFFDYLALAVWIGVLAGFLEFTKHYFGGWWIHRMIFFGPHSVWMAPAASAILFALAGCLLFLLRRAFPKFVTLRRSTALLVFLALFNVALLSSRVHPLACFILAAGCAKVVTDIAFAKGTSVLGFIPRIARWMIGVRAVESAPQTEDTPQAKPAPEEFVIDRRRLLLSSAVAVGGPAVGVNLWLRDRERKRAAARPAAKADAPNVLLLVLDTVRSRSLSVYGYERDTTPNLRHIAKQGVCFDWAIAEAPWTLPSHASMFTGQHAHDLGCTWYMPLGKKVPTLAESLRSNGYNTSGFVANTIYCNSLFGINRGFDHYEDVFLDVTRVCQASNLTRTMTEAKAFRRLIGFDDLYARPLAPRITDRFLHWVDRQGNEPFFAFLNYFDAHAPYVPPAPFDTKFGPRREGLPFNLATEYTERQRGWLSEEEIQAETNAYDGAIAYVDREMGRVWDEMQQRGLLDNTIVIILGDHGEEFAEHGLMGHANSLYMPGLHVPLIMVQPDRIPVNERIESRVGLRDLPRTVLDLTGIEDDRFPGASMSRHWSGPSSAITEPIYSNQIQLIRKAEWYPASSTGMQSVCLDNFHFIRAGDSEELYNFLDDPLETQNLITTPEGRAMAAKCREIMRRDGAIA